MIMLTMFLIDFTTVSGKVTLFNSIFPRRLEITAGVVMKFPKQNALDINILFLGINILKFKKTHTVQGFQM